MTLQRTELLLGCGRNRHKKLHMSDHPEWTGLVTLDNNQDVEPDILFDLNQTTLPFNDDELDEIHAYECLEHVGKQGDSAFFFDQFSDFYRALKPNGYLFITVPLPSSVWAWGDPSHTRILPKEAFMFLHQPTYEGVKTSPMSDFRYMYKADFDIIHVKEEGECQQIVMQAVKPSRISS